MLIHRPAVGPRTGARMPACHRSPSNGRERIVRRDEGTIAASPGRLLTGAAVGSLAQQVDVPEVARTSSTRCKRIQRRDMSRWAETVSREAAPTTTAAQWRDSAA
jgi:hypothetical protein